MTKPALSASITLVLTAALSTLALAQSVKPRASNATARPANVTIQQRNASPLLRMKVTTPAVRARDLSRKGLLANARKLNPPGTTKAQYLNFMRALWVQDLDANSDGSLSWQNGPESLGSKIGTCVVVKYKKQEAKKEKDLSHPGQWIETPEAWVPEDWLTWGEALGATSFDGGECQVIGTEEVWRCMTKDGQKPLPPPESGWTMPSLPCTDAWGFPTVCNAKVKAKFQCEVRGGLFETFTKMEGCEKWQHFGPDSMEAFLSVASRAFDAEDHNASGVIENGESQYLCYN